MADVIILGAGMVGVGAALHLRQRGHAVTLVDRRPPGRETSYGNAGIIQREAVEPHPFPRSMCTLARVALQRDNSVHYQWPALPRLTRVLFDYWVNSSPARHARITRAYAALIEHCLTEHQPWIEKSGADHLVQRKGYHFIFRRAATWREGVQRAERLARDYNVGFQALDAKALCEAEPGLLTGMAGGIHWTDPWSVSSPGQLVEHYARLFQGMGGTLLEGDATTLKQEAGGWSVQTVQGRVQAEHVVVALGPWSQELIATLGYRYPLFIKRGYHRHYQSSRPPQLPVLDADEGLVIVPMLQGVRITTGAEFAAFGAPPTLVQTERSRRLAGQMVELGEPVEPQPWLGSRPCTADMLPVIGPAPRHRGLWFNFGHAHQGFTLGPATGRLIADLIEGGTPYMDPTPYLPARFGS